MTEQSYSPRLGDRPYRVDDRVQRCRGGRVETGTVAGEDHHWVTVRWDQELVHTDTLEMVRRADT